MTHDLFFHSYSSEKIEGKLFEKNNVNKQEFFKMIIVFWWHKRLKFSLLAWNKIQFSKLSVLNPFCSATPIVPSAFNIYGKAFVFLCIPKSQPNDVLILLFLLAISSWKVAINRRQIVKC